MWLSLSYIRTWKFKLGPAILNLSIPAHSAIIIALPLPSVPITWYLMLVFKFAKACPVTTKSSQKGARSVFRPVAVDVISLVHSTDVEAVLNVIHPLVQARKPVTGCPWYLKVVPVRLTAVLVLSSPLVALVHPA